MPTDPEHTKGIVCPYCGHEQRDEWEIVGRRECGETSCGSCDKLFDWSMHTVTTFTTRKMEPDNAD